MPGQLRRAGERPNDDAPVRVEGSELRTDGDEPLGTRAPGRMDDDGIPGRDAGVIAFGVSGSLSIVEGADGVCKRGPHGFTSFVSGRAYMAVSKPGRRTKAQFFRLAWIDFRFQPMLHKAGFEITSLP